MTINLPLTPTAPLPPNFRKVVHGDGYLVINDGPPAIVDVTVFGVPVLAAKTFNGVRGNWIMQGEAMLAASWAPMPDDAKRLALRQIIGVGLDTELLQRPRIKAVLENFGEGTTGDFGWTQSRANRKAWLGETEPPVDQTHLDLMNAIGAEGWNNGHYDLPFWCFVHWLWTGNQGAWNAFLRWTIGQSTQGFVWSGPQKGMHRQEKGYDYPGSSLDPSPSDDAAWEKQWIRSAVAGHHSTGMPIFEWVCQARRAALRALPSNWYDNQWGVRRAARPLDDMLTLHVGMGYPMADRIEPWVRHVVGLLDPVRKLWLNHGNGGAAPSSPWMMGENWTACWTATDVVPVLADLKPKLMEAAAAIEVEAVNRTHGVPICWYRTAINQNGTQQAEHFQNQNLGLAGFLLPMLRISNPALYQEMSQVMSDRLPALISQVDQGYTPPISDIRCNYGPQGSAHYKLMLEVLHGCRR